MAKSLDQVKEEMLQSGLVDERKSAVFANAKNLPNGEYGLCVLGINKGILTVSGASFSQEIDDKLYKVQLNQITDIKSSSFVFNRYVQFTYQNFRWKFADFGDAKNFIEALNAECAVS